jgi:hypothetical protein
MSFSYLVDDLIEILIIEKYLGTYLYYNFKDISFFLSFQKFLCFVLTAL